MYLYENLSLSYALDLGCDWLEMGDLTILIIMTKPEEVLLLGHGRRNLDTSFLCHWLSVTRLPHPTCVN